MAGDSWEVSRGRYACRGRYREVGAVFWGAALRGVGINHICPHKTICTHGLRLLHINRIYGELIVDMI
jgi:hypothetical protein